MTKRVLKRYSPDVLEKLPPWIKTLLEMVEEVERRKRPAKERRNTGSRNESYEE